MIRDYNDVHASLPDRSLVVTPTSSSLRALRAVLGTLPPDQGWEEQARRVTRIRNMLGEQLPAPLAAACQAWLEGEDVLVLACSSGAVAAKLKQSAPRLLLNFRTTEPQISAIRVEVQADFLREPQRSKSRTPSPPPPTAAPELEAAAARIRAPELSAAMLRLAARLRERSTDGGKEPSGS